jgi:transposase
VARTASLPGDAEAFIKILLTLADVLHVDETSTSIAGDTQWFHVACTDTLTAYHQHISTVRKHGINVMTALRDGVTGNQRTLPLPT